MPRRWRRWNTAARRAGIVAQSGLAAVTARWCPGPSYEDNGRSCRSYTHTIYIDGRPQTARGTACRNPDGTWTPLS